MSAAEFKEYEAKRREKRRQAQKRIEREQLQKIRDRERKQRDLEKLQEEQKNATKRWEEKQKKQQEHLLEVKEGKAEEGPGQALHPSTMGIKLRNPRAYTRFYPHAVQPCFNGYKAVRVRTQKKGAKMEKISPLTGGGKLEVHPISAEGLPLPKGLDNGSYYVTMRMGGDEQRGDVGTKTGSKGLTFPPDKDAWYQYNVPGSAAKKPPYMTIRIYRDKLKLGDADINWAEKMYGGINEKTLSKQGIQMKMKLKNRHGKSCGEATVRLRWTRAAKSDDDMSLVDLDVMGGRKMRFDVPPLDPLLRWMDPDSIALGESGSEYSDDDDDDKKDAMPISDEEKRRRGFMGESAYADPNVDDLGEDSDDYGYGSEDEADSTPVGAHKTTFMTGSAQTEDLTAEEHLQYNASMMIHPSFFGYDIVPLTCQQSEFISPVFFNTYLKLGDDAEDDLNQPFNATGGKRKKWKPIPGVPDDLEKNGCPVCFSGDRPGCPCCWSFPDVEGVVRGVRLSSLGASASDAAINETMTMPLAEVEKLMTDLQLKEVKAKLMADLHTKLRSHSEILAWRELKKQYIRVYIKCMLPSGPVVTFTVSTDDTVYYLYKQYASCCGTVAEHCGPHMKLMIPTENGIFVLDNTDLPEDDLQLGQITCDYKLAEFNIENANVGRFRGKLAEVTLLMLPVINTKSQHIIKRWLDLNVNMDPIPPCELQYYQVNPISVWSGDKIVLPAQLPGIDTVQLYLNDMQAHELGMYASAMEEDRADRLAKADEKMQEAYTLRKTEATARATAARQKVKQDKADRLHALVADVSDIDATPFQAQLKGLKPQKTAKRRKRAAKAGAPKPKGLKAFKQTAKRLLLKTEKTLRTIGPVVADAAFKLKESLKDVAEETILDMIDEIEDQRELDDIPQGMYQAGETRKKKLWPHEEYEIVTVHGRTTTLKSLLAVAKALGRPFEFPEVEQATRRGPKVWGIPPPRRTNANLTRERKLALAKLKNQVGKEADSSSGDEDADSSEEADSSSDDESGDLPGLFDPNKLDMLQAPPASLQKQGAYHLPVLFVTANNS
jgi:hypothetical protein